MRQEIATRISGARELTEILGRDFLKNGNFQAAGAPADAVAMSRIFPTTSDVAISYSENHGFSGLSVQSVGYSNADRESVFIYVTRGGKRVLDKLSNVIDGIPVNVTNIGNPIVRPEASVASTMRRSVFLRNNRIACGSSCAPAGENYSGTFGALVKSDKYLMALSNNHVFGACNHTEVGQPVLSPSAVDASPNLIAPREICRHHEIIELRSGTPALVPLMQADAATAIVQEEDAVSSWQGDNINGYDTPSPAISPKSGMRVKKFGRTTGLTLGTVESMIALMSLPYKNRHFSSTVWFTNVWIIRADADSGIFALPGDSGSLVVAEDGRSAIGLLFAATSRGEYGFIAPICTILDELGLSLVDGHGI